MDVFVSMYMSKLFVKWEQYSMENSYTFPPSKNMVILFLIVFINLDVFINSMVLI